MNLNVKSLRNEHTKNDKQSSCSRLTPRVVVGGGGGGGGVAGGWGSGCEYYCDLESIC